MTSTTVAGMPVYVLKETDSTNAYIKRCVRGGEGMALPRPCCVTALRQSGGRGRLGRSFVSPEGGLYMSVLLPSESPEKAASITPLAAVAVCRALEDAQVTDARIKWVNDVYIGDQKICGILCEGVEGGVVIGIGVNVTTPEGGFPDGAGPAGAIDRPGVTREGLLQGILAHLQSTLGDPTGALYEYRALSCLTGQQVMCQVGDSFLHGTVQGIDEAFGLILQTEEGDTMTLRSGEVTRVRPVSKAAFFDFDGTMRKGDSIVPYVNYAKKQGCMSLLQYAKTLAASIGFVLKAVPAERAKTVALAFQKTMTADEKRALDEGFARLLLQGVYADAKQKWDELRGEGCRMVLLSASTENYMKYVAALLQADALMCTAIEQDGAVRLNCHGREKVVRAEAYAAQHGVDFEKSYAFGDSGSDVHILTRAGQGYAVNPKKKLVRLAAAYGLPTLRWK